MTEENKMTEENETFSTWVLTIFGVFLVMAIIGIVLVALPRESPMPAWSNVAAVVNQGPVRYKLIRNMTPGETGWITPDAYDRDLQRVEEMKQMSRYREDNHELFILCVAHRRYMINVNPGKDPLGEIMTMIDHEDLKVKEPLFKAK